MTHVTVQTLAFAIFSLVFDRCRLVDRINSVSSELEADEHLSDTLVQMDKALGELAAHYEHSCRIEGRGLSFETLYLNAEEDYRRYCTKPR